MSVLLRIGFIAVLIFSFFFASWYVIHQDIVFSADIARDFHLLREVDEKKLILIGPRSSTGLFHGPLWTYLNYPAFVIGNGNPLAVGWYWIFLSALFVTSCYLIAKDLFGKTSAHVFTLMTAVYMGYHTMGMFNPHGAMFFIPAFFYFFIKYLRTKKAKFLAFHLITGGLIIQFQLALGIPLLMLSSSCIIVSLIRKGNKKHLLFFLSLPLMIVNFVLFDLRHDFLLFNKLLGFITPQTNGEIYNYFSLVRDRLSALLNGTEILRHDAYGYLNIILFLSIIFIIFLLRQEKKNRDVYFYFLYFYIGFFLLSFIDKGPILYFYIFPLFPLVFLIISSFLDSKYTKYLIIPILMILTINISNAVNDMKYGSDKIGNDLHSWKFLKEASDKIFTGKENELGYFVFSPDAFSYEGRYAMIYASETGSKQAHYFQKKPVTYIFIAPTPKNDFITGDAWWTKNKLMIDKKPASTVLFDNGYKIEKYFLDSSEVAIPPAPGIDTGLHFR